MWLFSLNNSRFFVFIVLFCLSIIPQGIIQVSFLFCLLSFVFLIESELKLFSFDILLVMSLLAISLVSLEIDFIVNSIVYSVFYICFLHLKIEDCRGFYSFKILFFLFLLSIAFQIFYSFLTGGIQDDEGMTRLSLTIGDPNFSGLLIFIFVTIMYFNGWVVVSIITSLLTVIFIGSRGFLLSTAVFFALEILFSKKRMTSKFFIFIQFVSFFMVVHFISNWDLYLSSLQSFLDFFLKNVESSRLVNFYDRSNIGRFTAFDYYINKLFSDVKLSLFGAGSEAALFEYSSVLPHNSMIYFLCMYGAPYCLLSFIALYRVIKHVTGDRVSLSVACSFTFYATFLHGAYSYVFLSPLMVSFLYANNRLKNEAK